MTLFLPQRTDLFDGRPKRLLHVAPEPQFARLFRRVPGIRYVSMDISGARRPTIQGDLARLAFADGSFDAIYCSHVLEHVPDDRAAMRELRRILRPGGWAILQVPGLRGPTTYEDAAITTPEGRLAAFGQEDHVRRYGRDYIDRLREAGFDVTVERYALTFPDDERRRYGLSDSEEVFFCRRPS